MTLGPFEITAEQVAALGPRFTPFVNRLLEVEARAHEISGHQLTVNVKESIPDKGVDAALEDSVATDFIPGGNSAWQFKRSGLGPKACADELEGATWAHDYLRGGGAYIMVLGVALTDNLIKDRRKKLLAKAVELGLLDDVDRDRIRVYDANFLARWTSLFPSLAVNPLAGGPGGAAVDLDTWAAGRTHVTVWVPDDDRKAAIEAIRNQVTSEGVVDIRVQGEQGNGKTRLVLEALRVTEISPLVAYVPDPAALGGEFLHHLITGKRAAVLVVDECPAEKHVKLVERLPSDPAIKLVTIGDVGTAATKSPVIGVGSVSNDISEEFLKVNYAQLSPEARRFVADHSRGNMRWTILLAERVVGAPSAQAAELIARNDIEQFIETLLPEGRDFFCATILALLDRVGWEGGLRTQVELLADFAGATVAEMESAAFQLERRGLLSRQGRYRAVTPHPLAVYLAAEIWRTHAERLVVELLPNLDEQMALGFFRRVADLGRFEPARSVLPHLLSEQGGFDSLETIEARGLGQVLTQLAIVMPDEVANHMHRLISSAEIEVLRSQGKSRRDLVWTLEKLVWHSTTFETAADTLLRLALAENETYANNATETWLSLFATLLPATAASPTARLDYLRSRSVSDNADTRRLVARGATGALAFHESVMVSGELQGGVLVEPRGTPQTWQEAGEYRNQVIGLLLTMTQDQDEEVAAAARQGLIGALHALIDDHLSRETYVDAVTHLQGEAATQLRVEVERLLALYGRKDVKDTGLRERLTEVLDRLPPPTEAESIRSIVALSSWDLPDGELTRRVEEALRRLPSAVERRSLTLSLLSEGDVPAAWELGRALAVVDGLDDESLASLIDVYQINPSALLGYLRGLVDGGQENAFDEVLEGEALTRLSLRDRTSLSTRGPVTDRSRRRSLDAAASLSVAEAAFALFGWHGNLSNEESASLLQDWMTRTESQQDYTALIDWTYQLVHGVESIPDYLKDTTWWIVQSRTMYPEISRARWHWNRLAQFFVRDHPLELTRLLLDLMESGGLMIIDRDDEAVLLSEAAKMSPVEVWAEVAQRLESSWRVSMQVAGWFLEKASSSVVTDWIADDVDRGRAVSRIAPVGDERPSPIAEYLLTNFAGDKEIGSNLYGQLVSGVWTGPESNRLSSMIDQLRAWLKEDRSEGIRQWTERVIESLEKNRTAALQREAEDQF